MINNNALESSNNYSLIVTKRNGYNVETLSNAQPPRWNSLLRLISFRTKGNVHPHSPQQVIRIQYALVQSGSYDNKTNER